MAEAAPRLPDLFICGFTKCGTSSLHDWLVQHPRIAGGFQKELEYLYDPESHFFRPDRNVVVQGLEGYSHLFPDPSPETLWLDATPAYAYHEMARKTIAAMPHRPPAIFVARDPVDQIASTYHYFYNNKMYIDREIGVEDFFEMALDGRARTRFPQDHLRHALDWACFGYWIALWERDLGADRILRLDMREMIADPGAASGAIFARLGLGPLETGDFSGANETYFVRNRAFQSLNAALRGIMPKGALYDFARTLYRKLNTTSAKPERSAREVALRRELSAAVAHREAELLAGMDAPAPGSTPASPG